jgi:hypothetical protein
MKYSILSMILFYSCSTRSLDNESMKLTQMWTSELIKTDVINIYGSDFMKVEGGIAYQRTQSSWPKFAFFFDKDNKVINQYALLDKDELNLFKKHIDCSWKETQTQSVTPHASYDIPIGECERYSLRYEFKKDFGLYEIRWMGQN